MNALALLSELERAGIRLGHDGDGLFAVVLPDAELDPYRARIAEHRSALLSVLHLQDQIVTAATIDPTAFDRGTYEALWTRWYAFEAQENSS